MNTLCYSTYCMDTFLDNTFGPILLGIVDDVCNSTDIVKVGRISSGFKSFDKYTGGIKTSSLGVIAARQGDGKTALEISLALNMAFSKNPITIGLFSYSLDKTSIVERVISNRLRMDLKSMKNREISPEGKAKIMETVEFLHSQAKNFVLEDSPGLTIESLSSQIRDMVYKNKVKVIFLLPKNRFYVTILVKKT